MNEGGDEAGGGVALRRSLSLPMLVFYGLGTILGAGIYVLIGEVAGLAGMAAPLAFLIAGVVAGFTAFSYAELASRIPKSAGEAAFVRAGFGMAVPAALAGWGVVLTGIVSASTIANGFVGYLTAFVDVPKPMAVAGCVVVLGVVACFGVRFSVGAAAAVTLLEIAGLVIVCGLALWGMGEWREDPWEPIFESGIPLHGLFLGGFIAFFAFIGFEDIVNMAEEVKDPTRVVPKAILWSMGVATLLYMLVATIAVMAVPPGELAGEKAPLVRVISGMGPWARGLIGVISMVAVINGALIQIIMAARVIYGMAGEGLAPKAFRALDRRRRIPLRATLLVTGIVLAMALSLSLVTLAQTTSAITLFVFALVNAALWKIKVRDGDREGAFRVPLWVPIMGFLLCAGFLVSHFVF